MARIKLLPMLLSLPFLAAAAQTPSNTGAIRSASQGSGRARQQGE